MTLVSIVLFCIETLPVFSMTHCVKDEAPNFLDPFFVIETVCTAWFTIEVGVRFAASPSKLRFWRDFKNIVDVMAIVPYYVTLVNVVSSMSCASAKSPSVHCAPLPRPTVTFPAVGLRVAPAPSPARRSPSSASSD